MNETIDLLPTETAETAETAPVSAENGAPAPASPAAETAAEAELPQPETDGSAAGQDPAPAAAEAALQRARAEAVLAGWEREADAVREIYPAFDLYAELARPGDFPRMLQAGLGVRRAYEAAHLEEILSSAMRYAALRAGQRAAAAIEAQRARPQENPVANRAAVRTATDVNSLTRSDILRILGEVSRGARITFK